MTSDYSLNPNNEAQNDSPKLFDIDENPNDREKVISLIVSNNLKIYSEELKELVKEAVLKAVTKEIEIIKLTKENTHRNQINKAIVAATGGVLIGAALSSIGLPIVLTGAIIGALAGAAIGVTSKQE